MFEHQHEVVKNKERSFNIWTIKTRSGTLQVNPWGIIDNTTQKSAFEHHYQGTTKSTLEHCYRRTIKSTYWTLLDHYQHDTLESTERKQNAREESAELSIYMTQLSSKCSCSYDKHSSSINICKRDEREVLISEWLHAPTNNKKRPVQRSTDGLCDCVA